MVECSLYKWYQVAQSVSYADVFLFYCMPGLHRIYIDNYQLKKLNKIK